MDGARICGRIAKWLCMRFVRAHINSTRIVETTKSMTQPTIHKRFQFIAHKHTHTHTLHQFQYRFSICNKSNMNHRLSLSLSHSIVLRSTMVCVCVCTVFARGSVLRATIWNDNSNRNASRGSVNASYALHNNDNNNEINGRGNRSRPSIAINSICWGMVFFFFLFFVVNKHLTVFRSHSAGHSTRRATTIKHQLTFDQVCVRACVHVHAPSLSRLFGSHFARASSFVAQTYFCRKMCRPWRRSVYTKDDRTNRFRTCKYSTAMFCRMPVCHFYVLAAGRRASLQVRMMRWRCGANHRNTSELMNIEHVLSSNEQ